MHVRSMFVRISHAPSSGPEP